MFLHLLLAAGSCLSTTEIPQKVVQQNTVVKLPCAHVGGDVSWSRLGLDGNKVVLASTKNGLEVRLKTRFGTLADNSLVITNVKPSDSGMYFCNRSQIYMKVTTDLNAVPPREAGPGQTDAAPAGEADQEVRQTSDVWKIPVGVVGGAALVLLVVLVLRLRSKERGGAIVEEAGTERVYEEIGEEPARSGPDVERPYRWASFTETPNDPEEILYCKSNKPRSDGRREEEEFVYDLVSGPGPGSGPFVTRLIQ